MDAWIKKVESGEKWSQVKISDRHFAKICKEWTDVQAEAKKRDTKYFKDIFYRTDVNMMAPLPGGRVGGLASPAKKYKMAKKQLGRTKHTTRPVSESPQWDGRFTVRTERSTELFCNKKWPKKLTQEEENELAMLEIGETYADMNTTFPHKKPTNTGNTSACGDTGYMTAIADDEDECGSPKSVPAYPGLEDAESRSPPPSKLEGSKGSTSRGSVIKGYPDESLLRTGAKLDDVDATTKAESTIDMTDVFIALHGKAPILTEAEAERQRRLAEEERFIAEAKERRAAKNEATNMTFDKLNSLSSAGLCDFLDLVGFTHYTEKLFSQGVRGSDLVACDEFDLSHLGFSFRPHRLKMLKMLDKLRGQSGTTFRRTLTKTIIDSTLKNPFRPKPVSDGYELQVSKMISKAKLAEMARAAAEARTLDLIASKNAEMAAIEQAKIRKRLESHAELYRAAKEIISNFKLRTAAGEVAKRQYQEVVVAEAKVQAAEEAEAADKRYADRQRIRDAKLREMEQGARRDAEARAQAVAARAARKLIES